MSSPIAYEMQWPAVASQNLTANATAQGLVTVPSTDGFFVLQTVTLSGTALPTTNYVVLEVASPTTLYVGAPMQFGHKRGRAQAADVSIYTTAATSAIVAALQNKILPEPNHQLEAVMMGEPTSALRMVSVDERGKALVRPGKYERFSVAGTAITATTAGTANAIGTPTDDPKTLVITNFTDKEVMITVNLVDFKRLPAGNTGSALSTLTLNQGGDGGGVGVGQAIGAYNTTGAPTLGTVEVLCLETR